MKLWRNLAFLAMLGTFMIFLNSDVRANYFGYCDLEIYVEGAGACFNPGAASAAAFDRCDGACLCYCGDMEDYMLGGNACEVTFGGHCTPSGEYCAAMNESCSEEFPCCTGAGGCVSGVCEGPQ